MQQTNPYETYANEYESWFQSNDKLFESELDAIGQLMPLFTKGIEIGVGTGLFAQALGINEGVEPTDAMRSKAEARGIRVFNAFAEKLPFADASYDFALMVTVDCFLNDVHQAYRELFRILKMNGSLIVAFLDQSSPLGTIYEQKKKNNPFYSTAHFHTAKQIQEILTQVGFQITKTCQTVFSLENQKQEIHPGTGDGVFAVILALRP